MENAILQAVNRLAHDKRARLASARECESSASRFGSLVPSWYWQVLREVPLVGRSVSLVNGDHHHDLCWLDPAEMVVEAFDTIPGSDIRSIGYVPVAGCDSGSGDPYFVRFAAQDTAPVVQVHHDVRGKYLVANGELGSRAYLVVGESISDVLSRSTR